MSQSDKTSAAAPDLLTDEEAALVEEVAAEESCDENDGNVSSESHESPRLKGKRARRGRRRRKRRRRGSEPEVAPEAETESEPEATPEPVSDITTEYNTEQNSDSDAVDAESVDTETEGEEPSGVARIRAEMQRVIDDKSTVIAALTQRLEQAAEQLDRVRRMGPANNSSVDTEPQPRRSAAGSLSTAESLSEMTRMLQHLDDADVVSSLMRIEMQVCEVRDLICQQGEAKSAPARRTQTTPAPASTPPAQDSLSAWEQMKADMLGEAPRATDAVSDSVVETPTPTESIVADQGLTTVAEQFFDAEAFELPEELVFEMCDRVDLEVAIEARNRCITQLLKELRRLGGQRYQVPDFDALADTPDALRTNLEDLSGRLEETLKVAEVELSLERARLGREKVRLAQMEASLSQTNKPDADGETTDGEKGNRWRRLLGIGDGN